MQLIKQQTQEIYSGIFLNKRMTRSQDQLIEIFELEVKIFNNVQFQIDFTGSQNFKIKGYGSAYKISKLVQSREPTIIAQVQLHEGWKLKTVFRFFLKPTSKDKQLNYIKSDVDAIEQQKIMIQKIFKNTQIILTPLQQLNSQLARSKTKFIDLEFPPTDFSIFGTFSKDLIDGTVNHWRRPESIFKNKQYFLIDRLNPNHLEMGKLLDRAFFSVVCALIRTHPQVIQRLFLNQKQISQYGIYKLCICKNGEWQTVIIDDYFPCQPFANPKFASSNLNEIWICLLQKVYAKVHGKYFSLYELEVSNVFNDLTGCPTIIINLEKPDAMTTIINYFNGKSIVVFYNVEENQFDQDQFTPQKHYAYLLTGLDQEKDGHTVKTYFKFISHVSNKQEQIEKDALCKKFKFACICSIENWEELRIKGKFISIVDAGPEHTKNSVVMSQWYYSIEVQETSQIHICLHQEDLLIRNNSKYKKYKYLSIVVFEKGEKSKFRPIKPKKYAHNREFHLIIQLTKGTYIIVPIINEQLSTLKAETEYQQILDVFRKLDLLMRRNLKYNQLQPFFQAVGQPFSQYDFDQILKKFSSDKKTIGFMAFKRMWEANKNYWEEGARNHYIKQSLFILSIHSKYEINLLFKNNIGTGINNRAHCQIISRYGKELESNQTNKKFVTFMYLESNIHIVEYMAENMYERKITVTLDCTESIEYSFMPVSGKLVFDLDSGERKFVMKLIPRQKSDPKHLVRKQKISTKVN